METEFKGITAVTIKVKGEGVFRVMANAFGVSPSAQGYTCKYSVDGTNFDELGDAVLADANAMFTNVPVGLYYKLVGNTDTVNVIYGVNN